MGPRWGGFKIRKLTPALRPPNEREIPAVGNQPPRARGPSESSFGIGSESSATG